jgi:hypothetical protein
MTIPEQLNLLETFFNLNSLPETIELGPGEKIVNIKKFLSSHFTALKNGCPAIIQIAYLDRLIKVHSKLTE